MIGKELRLSRLISPTSRKTCIVPIDHGTTMGPIAGLENPIHLIEQVVDGAAPMP